MEYNIYCYRNVVMSHDESPYICAYNKLNAKYEGIFYTGNE